MACIFCHKSPPEISYSKEHIFPDALGGSLIIKDSVCKNCNDKLGHSVDNLLTNSFLIQMVRMGLGISNRDGVIPTPLTNGEVVGHQGRKGAYKVNHDGQNEIRVFPLIKESNVPNTNETLKTILANPDEIEDVKNKIFERAKAVSDKPTIIARFRTVIKRPTIQKNAEMNVDALFRPILKIAYELGVYWLGNQYAKHINGIPIAAAVMGKSISNIEAQITFFPPSSSFEKYNIPSTHHLAMLRKENNQAWLKLRIFNLIEANILLAEVSDDFPNFTPRWLVINPLDSTLNEGAEENFPTAWVKPNGEIKWGKKEKNNYLVETYINEKRTGNTLVSL